MRSSQGGSDRRSGLLRPGQRRRDQVHQLRAVILAVFKVAGDAAGHFLSQFGQMELREAPVEDTVRIEDFSMADEVDRGTGHVYKFRRGSVRN
jgi:hypothetical protein